MLEPDLGSIILCQDAVGCKGQSRHVDRGAVHDRPNTPHPRLMHRMQRWAPSAFQYVVPFLGSYRLPDSLTCQRSQVVVGESPATLNS